MPERRYYDSKGKEVIVDTDSEYFKCLREISKGKKLSREEKSSCLQTLLDKELINKTDRGHTLTDFGERVLSDYQTYIESWD